MRTEQIASKALEKVNFDRYLLSNILFARIDELSRGAKPLVNKKVKTDKLARSSRGENWIRKSGGFARLRIF